MATEESQEAGRDGVFLTKKWLEATTFIEMPLNAYEHPARCDVELLGGEVKKFDLVGSYLTGDKAPIVVESKAYTTAGAQTAAYKQFLVDAYSATKRRLNSKLKDDRTEFMWVTTHPFGRTDNWRNLETEDYLRTVLGENLGFLDGEDIDEQTVRLVAQRVWLLVRNPKQDQITMDSNEVNQVCTLLKRRG